MNVRHSLAILLNLYIEELLEKTQAGSKCGRGFRNNAASTKHSSAHTGIKSVDVKRYSPGDASECFYEKEPVNVFSV